MKDVRVEANKSIKIIECGEEMVVLNEKDFVLEPLYFEWGYSETSKMTLRKIVDKKLLEAKKNLPEGWNFKIWDGYRTLKVQGIIYDNYFKELREEHTDWSEDQIHAAVQIFVAKPSFDPLFPSPHNTGGAVDLTLVDENETEVPMGTEFDEFNEKSYTNHFEKGEFHKNRDILRKVLETVGFENYHEEWWHFHYGTQEWVRASKADHAIYGSVELN